MNRRGFTLIELLVVIAIIAILAAILFPVFMNAKEQARVAQCLSNLKELQLAFQRYCDDNNGGTPFAGQTEFNWCGCSGPNVSNAVNAVTVKLNKGQLWPYTKSAGIFLCPTDKNKPGRYFTDPATFPLSYSINEEVCSGQSPVRLESISCIRYSKVMLFIQEPRGTPGSTERPGINDAYFMPSETSGQDLASKVHYDGTTLAYLDGHAKYAPFNALMQERKDGYWYVNKQ
jgi:prepilin-type N-terminal cleavage/methylation domain-containing protein